MKKSLHSILMVASTVAIVFGFSACGSLPTVQQQFVTQCSIVNGDLQVIGASQLLNADQKKLVLEQILPANEAVCKGVATLNVNVADLKALHDSLLPAAVALIQSLPSFPDQTVILLGLNTFGPLVQQEVDTIITAVAAKKAAASAPASASIPH